MAWLMLFVTLWNKPVITVSLYAPFACQFWQNKRIKLSVSVWKALSRGLVEDMFCFFFRCMVSLCLFSLWDRLAAFKWKQMIICDTHFLFFSLCFCVSPHPPELRTHARAQMNTFRHTHTKEKKATLHLPVLLSLGTIKSLPQILLRVDEQGDKVEYHEHWRVVPPLLSVYICVGICVHVCVHLPVFVRDASFLLVEPFYTFQIRVLIDTSPLIIHLVVVKKRIRSVGHMPLACVCISFYMRKTNSQVLYFIGFYEYNKIQHSKKRNFYLYISSSLE